MSNLIPTTIRFSSVLIASILVIIPHFKCMSSNPISSSALFVNCMETFKEEQKCFEMITKMEPKVSTQKKLDPIREQTLFIRNELKDLLDTKSKSFVLETLGEPQEKYSDGSGRDFFRYTKPISRYSLNHDPDTEILIIFKKNFVSKVVHKKSESTP